MIVTFFGHRDAPSSVQGCLRATIVGLIEQGADIFYVGNHGEFDRMVRATISELTADYPHIRCEVVLAYLPAEPLPYATLYPAGMELTPPRFAIDARNRWMIAQSDTVVTYVCRSFGGAATYKRLAQRRGRRVIELAE